MRAEIFGEVAMVRRVLTAVVVAVVALGSSSAVGPASAEAAPDSGSTGWQRPVTGRVLRGFEPAEHWYAPAHRGIDLAAEPGEIVRAAGAGTVVFAGTVAGSRHVVLLHDNGWRTGYSFVDRISVVEGVRVSAGDPIAICCGADDHLAGAEGAVLHFALRIGDDYVDPMLLFSPPDLTELVHLAASATSEYPASRRSAIAMILEVTGVSTVADWGADTLAFSGLAIDVFGDMLRAGADRLPELARFLDSLDPLPVGVGAMFDIAEGTWRWIDQQDECDHDPPEPGSIPQSNQLMFVAGISSHTNADGSTNGFDAEGLGYAEEDIHWYSYAPDSGDYDADDTYAPIDESARRLGEQLRALQREHPGRSVDLVAHSQGGVVVQTFLKLHYDPADPTLPPIGTVVTLSSPHQGAPAATSGEQIEQLPNGSVLIDAIPSVPPSDAQSSADLAETSALMARLHDTPLPPGLEFVTIGAPYDWVVPATATRLDGATSMTANPEGLFNQHSKITTDRATQYVVNNALLGRAAPCVSLATSLAASYFPERIAWVEHQPGTLVELLGASR